MATESEHRLAAARVALATAMQQANPQHVADLRLLEVAYLGAVLDAQDACGNNPGP